MKRFLMALMTVGAGLALSATFAASASAAPSASSETPDAAAFCSAVAEEHRSVWAAPGTSEGTVGGVVAGRTYTADCSLVVGETYTACGSTTDLWALVNYAGDEWGYLPSACLTWAS